MRSPTTRRRVRRTRIALTLARVRRSTALALAAALATAGIAGIAVDDLLDEAARARDRWGETVEVDVVLREVAPGEVIGHRDVRAERRPRALVPSVAAQRSAGRVARALLVPGEVVVEARLASDLVPPGWRAIAVPPPGAGGHPDVRPGERVDVIDVAATEGGPVEGIVVGVRERDGLVTVAVPREAAAAVAYAATGGTAVLALIAAPPRR